VDYFALLYRLNSENQFLIWITSESDSVVVDAEGFIPTFKDRVALRLYAERNGFTLTEAEPILHDLDWVATWTRSPAEPCDYHKVLGAWNLFSDVAGSVGARGISFAGLDQRCQPIYERVFWGSNLPAVTPAGCHFVPDWRPDEVTSMTELLSAGMEMFSASIRGWPPE